MHANGIGEHSDLVLAVVMTRNRKDSFAVW